MNANFKIHLQKLAKILALFLSLFLQNLQGQDGPKINFIGNNRAYDGYIFLATITLKDTHPNHYYILDKNGNVLVDRSLNNALDGKITDFKPQPGDRYSFFNDKDQSYYILDKNMNLIDKVTANCDCFTDDHELIITPDNHYFLMALDRRFVDMTDSVYNGFSATNVAGLIIQELDSARNVLFEWNSFDHLSILDSRGIKLAGSSVDYVHANSIDLDTDTSLIVSCRHLNAVLRINRNNGDIIWRFGKNAAHNNFTIVNDSIGFSYQHDARILPNRHLTLFDNGNLQTGKRYSRACEYEIDEDKKTATLVWQYRHTPDVVSNFMGNVQRLPNGNTLIGWGGTYPTATEIDSQGNTVTELSFPANSGYFSYRVFKFPVSALPSFLGLQKMEKEPGGLTLFPNPAKGNVHITTDLPGENDLYIYNNSGQVIQKSRINGTCEVKDLPKGIFMVVARGMNDTRASKLVIN